MFNVETYMQDMIEALQERFEERLLFVGLQGSYLREEATENSDLDVVVILDELSETDLMAYKMIVEDHPNPEKACGFICGRSEIENWNPLEACNFLHGTRNYYGTIAEFVPSYRKEDVVNFIKLSAGNLYHEICHRYVHADAEQNRRKLPISYKSVFFILQSIYYLRDGVFYPTKKEIHNHLTSQDKLLMEKAEQIRKEPDYNFEEAFCLLLTWCKHVLAEQF